MKRLLKQIRNCRACEKHLLLGVNPVISAGAKSRIIIIGQAPGKIVHNTGIPWNDKSGDNLRSWLDIDKTVFYDPDIVALMPMSFCYPGKGVSGDLPPRIECAPLWHGRLLTKMPEVKLILLIGQYAQHYYLGEKIKDSLTETVKHFKEYLPQYFVLPHPSPRNNIWQAKNEWFSLEVVPVLREHIKRIIGNDN